MTKILSPEETREHSIFSLLRVEKPGLLRWLLLLVLVAAAWLGGVAFLAPFRRTQVSDLIGAIAPHDQIYWASLAVATLISATALVLKRGALAWAGATVTVYLVGWQLSGQLYRFFPPAIEIPFRGMDDAWAFAVSRIWFAAPIALLLLIVWLLFRRRMGPLGLALGIGSWGGTSRDFSSRAKPLSWRRELFVSYAIFVIIFALLLQAPVGFAPILGGNLWPLLPAICLAAIVNAAAEELIYRGFIQPAFIRYAGAGAGLWMQGLLFGIIHWGLSVGVLAALPVSLLIGLGSVVWGKAAYETRGLSWTIAAHFMVDVAIMSAYFVPH